MLYHRDGERDSEAWSFKPPQWECPSPGTSTAYLSTSSAAWPKAENKNGSM